MTYRRNVLWVLCFMWPATARPSVAGIHGQVVTRSATEPKTPYDIRLAPHLTYTLSSLLFVGIGGAYVKKVLPGGLNCPRSADNLTCSAAGLSSLDRFGVGLHNTRWGLTSDVVQYASLGAAALFTVGQAFLDGRGDTARDVLVDVVMGAEAVATATVVTQVFKYAVRRPRPKMYSPGAFGAESAMSFPSGHTSAVASIAAATATTTFLRYPNSARGWAIVGTGSVLTAVTAIGRIESGAHFLTDVTAGALLGGAIGYLVPQAFARSIEIVPGVPHAGGSAPGLSLKFDATF